MRMNSLSKVSLGVLAALTLSACSSLHSGSFSNVHDDAIKMTDPTFKDLRDELRQERPKIGQEFVGQHYVDPNNYEINYVDDRDLPDTFNQPAFLLVDKTNNSLDEVAAEIYEGFRIIVDVSDPKLLAPADDSPTAPPTLNTGVNADTTGQVRPFAGEEETSQSKLMKIKPFEFNGTLKELLDYISVLNNIKWKFDAQSNKIFFIKHEIKTFYVYNFNNDRGMETRVTTQTQQEGGDVTGGNQSQFESEEQVTPWKDVQDTINSMIGEDGSAAFDRKNGLVTVSSSDYILSRVDRYVNQLNDSSTKEITVAFHMIRVKVNESNAKSINVNYLNNLISGEYALEAGLGVLSPNIIANTPSLQEITGGNFLQASDGTFSALVGLLNTVGSATISAFDNIDILNNEYYNKSSTVNREYISSIQRQQFREGGGEDTISTETDVAVDGLNVRLKPRVIGDRIQIEYNLSNSTFDGFVDAGLGAGLEGVRLQNNSGFTVDHTAIVRNGQTRVVLATSTEDSTTNSQGPVNSNLWFLGGNENDTKDKEVTIITITAYYDN